MLRSKVCSGAKRVGKQSVPSHFEVKCSKEQNDLGSKVCFGSARAGKFQLELITSIYSVTQRFGSDEVDCRLSI